LIHYYKEALYEQFDQVFQRGKRYILFSKACLEYAQVFPTMQGPTNDAPSKEAYKILVPEILKARRAL
jgi:hypothetical protein